MPSKFEYNYEIAKELTLAIIDKIRPTENSTDETMNKSLANEVSKTFTIIYKAIKSVD